MPENENTGYRPPAVSIRATHTVGDLVDEVVVDIDQPVDAALIRDVVESLTARFGDHVSVDALPVSAPQVQEVVA